MGDFIVYICGDGRLTAKMVMKAAAVCVAVVVVVVV